MTCEWCGHTHDQRAICAKRPAARGMGRRSFLKLLGAGAVGAAAAAVLPAGATPVHQGFSGLLLYGGVPVVPDPIMPPNMMMFYGGRAGGGKSLLLDGLLRNIYEPSVHASLLKDTPFIHVGASGDPTPRK